MLHFALFFFFGRLNCSYLGSRQGPMTQLHISARLTKSFAVAEVKCGQPAVPMNAKLSLSDESLKPGTSATYSCDSGYELFG